MINLGKPLIHDIEGYYDYNLFGIRKQIKQAVRRNLRGVIELKTWDFIVETAWDTGHARSLWVALWHRRGNIFNG